jgi:signal transduction histidine kinase/ABC-type sugar transport system substrate-binding protein/AraC-like DNA-binding protein
MATLRLGVQLPPADPFWVQMREGIVQQTQAMGLDIVPIDLDAAVRYAPEQELSALELILAQELDALISHLFPTSLLRRLLEVDIPVIYLNEHPLRHPRFVTTIGLYESARIAARYLAERLGPAAHVLLVGEFESGRSRLAGASDVLAAFPQIVQHRLQSPWNDEQARSVLPHAMQQLDAPLDAVLGFSDGLALTARDVGRALGLVDDRTIVVGIDGDPLALAAIAAGSMAASVEVSPMALGCQAVELASQAARGIAVPPHCHYQPRLVTAGNVAEIAANKLIAMAHLPSRLVGVNRHQEQQQLAQLEASQEINRKVTSILDRAALSRAIVDLIRAHFGYDEVYLLRWLADEAALVYDQPAHARLRGQGPPDQAGMLREALRRDEVIFTPDIRRSSRFKPDPAWPQTIARVVVPIHVGERITGLLDLHSASSRIHTRQDLSGLQALADQLGTALRNAELYQDALEARAAAERADALKTRLLANVSHELRTPLNVILGYTQTILNEPQLYAEDLPPALLNDVRHVFQSGEHLIHLINDLLDLSRAEIGALDIFPERLDPRALLAQVFESMATRSPARDGLRWQLVLPPELPWIEADPVRVRQIVLNLLSNAEKFTVRGKITLGAHVVPPYLRIWVSDTGSGIPLDLHERIFEPFVTARHARRPHEGIGLGLSIVRQLVALHGGSMGLESQPGRGSTFQIELPLPDSHTQAANADQLRLPVLLLVAACEDDRALERLCRRQGLVPYHATPEQRVEQLFATMQPRAIACNVDRARADDWALLEQIRQHAEGGTVPLVLYSTGDHADERAWLTPVLVKPLQSAQLQALIASLCPAEASGPLLIVDDDPGSCAFYQQLIGSVLPGAAIRVALGGAAALALLAHEVPSLILLDLVMPDVDGFAVIQQLRAHERTSHVPVLVLSGKALSQDDVRRLSYAHVVYQSKDVLTAAELAAQVQRAFGGAQTHAAQTSRLVKQAVAFIQQHHQRALSRQEIARALGINQAYLSEIFQHELGLTPWEYLNRYRIRLARALLHDDTRSITEIASCVGFNDPGYFGRVFRRIVGCSPQQYRSSRAAERHASSPP